MYPKNRHKNNAEKRAKNAEKVRNWRERQREKAEEEEEERLSQEKLFSDMRRDGLLFFGETAPLVNCVNIAEEIEMARIWARLLGVRDIQPGENQRNYILEVMRAWCAAEWECPLLHLESLTLSKRTVDLPDVEKYEWPEGSDAPFSDEAAQQ